MSKVFYNRKGRLFLCRYTAGYHKNRFEYMKL